MKKIIFAAMVCLSCIVLAAPILAAAPETGVVADGQWKAHDQKTTDWGGGIEGINTTLSIVPTVERKILVDGQYSKWFPVDAFGPGLFSDEADGTVIGGVQYALMEELTVPVGTVITDYEDDAMNDFAIYKLFFSRTTEDGYDFYSIYKTDGDGNYTGEIPEGRSFPTPVSNRIFYAGGLREGETPSEEGVPISYSYIFDTPGLYQVEARHGMWWEGLSVSNIPMVFVIKAVDGSETPPPTDNPQQPAADSNASETQPNAETAPVAGAPETGHVADGKWTLFVAGENFDGYETTMSAVPSVERKILVDGHYDKVFPATGGPGLWSDGEDPTRIGGIQYSLMEELVVPVGTEITYRTPWAAQGDGLTVRELYYSHTTEEGYEFYSRFQTDENGLYLYNEREDGSYMLENLIYDGVPTELDGTPSDEEEPRGCSYTLNTPGLYYVSAFYFNLADAASYGEVEEFPMYFPVKVVADSGNAVADEPTAAAVTEPSLTLSESTPPNEQGVQPFIYRYASDDYNIGLMHLGAFAEFIGATPAWDGAAKTATVTGTDALGNPLSISLISNDTNITVNGQTFDIGDYVGAENLRGLCSALNEGAAVYLPLQAVTKAYGGRAEYDPETKEVTLYR